MTFLEWFEVHEEVSIQALALMMYLRHLQKKSGDKPFSISGEELAFALHCSNATIRKARNELVSAGWIEYRRNSAKDKRKPLYRVGRKTE